MYPGTVAAAHPERPAVVIDDGEVVVTYGDLDSMSNRLAHALRDGLHLGPGDGIAVMLENGAFFASIWWAAMRSGLYLTPVNWHLSVDEVQYIVRDCNARVLLFSSSLADVAGGVAAALPALVLVSVGHPVEGAIAVDDLAADRPETPVDPEVSGAPMFYSSGTTGRPKGIRPPLSGSPPGEGSLMQSIMSMYGLGEGDVYLSPGPLYHSSPALWSFGLHTVGATAVIMRRFDPELALRLIEHQRVTKSQWVPTMFIRLLRLPEAARHRYDLSSHRVAFHAAAPCPIEVKRRMIQWWGPIIVEFYAGTEGGTTVISTEEWLRHPGSVGRHWSGGHIAVLDPVTKEELPRKSSGLIYFPALANHRFEYYNDPEKTAAVYHGDLVTCGDVGYLDDDGYLYLTDRASDMIISGGVNIYPREVEEVLQAHPDVADAAVFGVPNEEFGEEVKAVVETAPHVAADDALAETIGQFCRDRLAHFKCPRSIDFGVLPRDSNGKLYKRKLRDRYWAGRPSSLV